MEAIIGKELEFKWVKKRGIGGKNRDVQFYQSFIYDGVMYALCDSVYLFEEGESDTCVGKNIKIWETRDKTKKVKVLWFFHPCKISDYLEGEGTAKNELFLASGEGLGLTTINPLEAIAGECNVVCTSKDSRNTQPSDEELQQADFIFYRGFDVGHLRILDEIQEKVAGIEVRFMFNRVDVQNPVVLEFDSEEKEVGGNTLASNGTEVLSQQNPSEESNNSRDYFRIQTF